MKALSFSRTILHGNRYYASASHISASIYTKYALSFVKNSRRAFGTRRREERRSLERVVGSNRGYSSSKTRNFREREEIQDGNGVADRNGSAKERVARLKLRSVRFYLYRIIYLACIPRTVQYKAETGGEETPDISTQAGSLETFELLARMGAWNGWWWTGRRGDWGSWGRGERACRGGLSPGWLGGNRQNQQRVTRTPRY